jgi:hypothetical protein
VTYLNYDEYEFEEAVRRSQELREAIRQARAQRHQAELELAPGNTLAPDGGVVHGEVVSARERARRPAVPPELPALVEDCFRQLADMAAGVRWKKIPPTIGEQMRRLVHEQVSGVIAVMQEQHRAIANAVRLQHDLELADLIFAKLTDPDTNVLQQELLLAEFERHRREALGIVAGQRFLPPSVL